MRRLLADFSVFASDQGFTIVYSEDKTIQKISISPDGITSLPTELFRSTTDDKLYSVVANHHSGQAVICWKEAQQGYCARYKTTDVALKPVKICNSPCYSIESRVGRHRIYIVSRWSDDHIKITTAVNTWNDQNDTFVEIDRFDYNNGCIVSNINVNSLAILFCAGEISKWKFIGEKELRTFDFDEPISPSIYSGTMVAISDKDSALLMLYSMKTSLINVSSFFPE